MYRPQFAYPAAPEGFVWQPCVQQFDAVNIPAFGNISLAKGQVSGYIPMELDSDAPFVLLAIRIQNSGLNVLLYDPWMNQLMDDFVDPRLYASELVPDTVLEGPGIEVPAGAVFQVRFQGQ